MVNMGKKEINPFVWKVIKHHFELLPQRPTSTILISTTTTEHSNNWLLQLNNLKP